MLHSVHMHTMWMQFIASGGQANVVQLQGCRCHVTAGKMTVMCRDAHGIRTVLGNSSFVLRLANASGHVVEPAEAQLRPAAAADGSYPLTFTLNQVRPSTAVLFAASSLVYRYAIWHAVTMMVSRL